MSKVEHETFPELIKMQAIASPVVYSCGGVERVEIGKKPVNFSIFRYEIILPLYDNVRLVLSLGILLDWDFAVRTYFKVTHTIL